MQFGILLSKLYIVLCREEVGPDAARKFLGHTQWLVNYWLLQNGFSIGIGDTIADAATMENINETISKAKNDVKKLIKQFRDNQLEAEAGESFENRVNEVLLDCLCSALSIEKRMNHSFDRLATCLPTFLYVRFLTRLVMLLEVVPRRVCLKVTI